MPRPDNNSKKNKALFLYKGYKFLIICAPNWVQKLDALTLCFGEDISISCLLTLVLSFFISLLFNFKKTSSKDVLPTV